jgi:hypothetical protein
MTPRAEAVTAYIESYLAPRVIALEGAVATADKQVRAYDTAFLASTQVATADLWPLIHQTVAVLTAHSTFCAGIGDAFAVSSAFRHDTELSVQLALLGEDLALFSAQVAATMQQTSADVAGMPRFLESPRALAYPARIGDALPILRRAEAWLEMIDRETGATVRLPGFGPRDPAIDAQLALL